MPSILVKTHKELDKAVHKCYRSKAFKSELERVELLLGLYEEYTAGLTVRAIEKANKRKTKSTE
jgi:hypothetical protein